jgi:hypothetical protein
MATQLRWLALGLSLSILLTTGCQTQNARPIAHLPPPSFDGPKPAPAVPARPQVATGVPRSWIPQTSPRPWKYIVIHHSASPTGSMAVFDKEHRAKGWDGVGYHFVIGNGSDSGDGQVEVTPRWPIQKWGAHAKTLDNRYNDYGIGICLVGNFDSTRPTQRQIQNLERLVVYLMQTYHIPPQNVIGHRDTKPTDCPGRYVNVAAIRADATRTLAASGRPVEAAPAQTARVELLGDITR